MNDCGCCTTPAAYLDRHIENRPGLSAIAYRVGSFATFRKAITDQLPRIPALAHLTARSSADYSLTAIELWSAVADVLTFYQERIANEAFLRTATTRDSVLRLVRLIDYQLRPGAAATTKLAFTLERGATALIRRGTRVQSVPGQGEKPQKFETLEALHADARLNQLRVYPRPIPDTPLTPGRLTAIVAPDQEAIAAAATLAPGDRVVLFSGSAVEVLTVREVEACDDLLVLHWAAPIGGSFDGAMDANDGTFGAYKLGRPFHIFGHDAPETVVVPEMKTAGDPTTTYLNQAYTSYKLHADGSSDKEISLDARYPGLKPGMSVLVVITNDSGVAATRHDVDAVVEQHVFRKATTENTGTEVTTQNGIVTQLTLDGTVTADPDDIRNIAVHELVGPRLRFWPNIHPDSVPSDELFIPGRRVGWSSVEVGRTIERGRLKPGILVDVDDVPGGRAIMLTDANGAVAAGAVAAVSIEGNGVGIEAAGVGPVLADLGLDPQHARRTTVLLSAPLGEVTLGDSRELSVTIGGIPTQTISLDPALVSPATADAVAAALQTALHAALPNTLTFSGAVAWVPSEIGVVGASGNERSSSARIAVAAGVVGDSITFAPSVADQTTLAALGLEPSHVRYLEGLVSAPFPATGNITAGKVSVRVGTNAPVERELAPIAWQATSGRAQAVANNYLQRQLGIPAHGTDDERLFLLPPIPTYDQRAYVRVTVRSDVAGALDAKSAILLGNVATASHGETVRDEVLGDGDKSRAFQRFPLKKKPATYVPGAIPGGVASSLNVLVDGLAWIEVPSLYGRGEMEQVFVTRLADDGTTTVQFGDGVTGARPSTGRQNISATYRQGLGLAGRVGARTLTTLLDRPTGVKGATNLLAADGGADPETLARARTTAPGTVRTFGRAVSLRDFEDTALLAGEVAKASASLVWDGGSRVIHITVAAQGGAAFSPAGLARLTATLASARDPNHHVVLHNYVRIPIRIDATIFVDDRHVASDVLAAARVALIEALSFDRRSFAQPVYLSDLESVLQNVAGVVSVDINTLDLKTTDPEIRRAHGVDDTIAGPQPRLLMLPARPSGTPGGLLPAELPWANAQDVTIRAAGGLQT